VNTKILAREWLIFLGCLVVGLTLVPFVMALPLVGPAVMREIRDPVSPAPQLARQTEDMAPRELFGELRRFVRSREFAQIPHREKARAAESFLTLRSKEIASLNESERMYVVSSLLHEAEPPLVKLQQGYSNFYEHLWDWGWIFVLIPYSLVQLVRSAVWAIRISRGTW